VVGIAEVKGGKVCLERPEQGCWYHNSLCRGARTSVPKRPVRPSLA